MKKTFNTPDIVELDFRDTSATACGVDGKRVDGSSGYIGLKSASGCWNLRSWLGGAFSGVFDDEDEKTYEEVE